MFRGSTAWWELVRELGDAPGPAQLSEAAQRVAGMPASASRPVPLRWIRRLADGEPVPALGLADTVDLGNGLSLSPGGFYGFFALTRSQLEAVIRAPLGGITRLSYSDDVGEHPLHPGFMAEPGDAAALLGGPWQSVEWLSLSGWGLGEFVASLLEAAAWMPAVRRLSMVREQWPIHSEDLPRILASPLLQRLECLDLTGYWSTMTPEHARLIAAAPGVQRLRSLHLGELPVDCAEILVTLRDHGVSVFVDPID